MPTQKWCSVPKCKNFVFSALDDFDEHGWSAFQIPNGSGEVRHFCPDHQKEMKDTMEKALIHYSHNKGKKED